MVLDLKTVLRCERDEAVEALESLEAAILESLPYRYDDGTDDEADPGECLGYAAEEIAKLRREVSRLQKMLDVCSSVHEHNVKLVAERDELRAEVERLQSWTPIGTYSLDVQHEEERRRLTMERDEARAERDALIGAGCSPEQNALALLDLYAKRTRDAEAARDEANANYCFMVQRVADEKLDGYRELGARAAAAENERDDLRRLLKEAHSELATIEAITVSPSDTDGLIELCNRMYEAIK